MCLLEDILIKPGIFGIGFMVLARDEAYLIELMSRYLFKKSQQSVKRGGCIN